MTWPNTALPRTPASSKGMGSGVGHLFSHMRRGRFARKGNSFSAKILLVSENKSFLNLSFSEYLKFLDLEV